METPNIPELRYQLVIDGAKKPNFMMIDIEPQAVERRQRYALRGEPLYPYYECGVQLKI